MTRYVGGIRKGMGIKNLFLFYTAGFFNPTFVANGSYQITAHFPRMRLGKCRFEMLVGLNFLFLFFYYYYFYAVVAGLM
jgi:hypothetical protein